MNFKRFLGCLALASVTFAGVGCHVQTTKDVMQSWIGHDVNQLIEKWGPPNGTFVMPNGNTMYTWTWSRTHGRIYGNVYSGWTDVCKKTFTVDPKGIVISGRWENC